MVRVLAETVAGLDGAELAVNIHHDVDDPAAHAHDPVLMAELRKLADRGALTLRVHDYFDDDDDLWKYLGGLDLSVLPYTFGTHSGWLEACHDLGTAVAAPDCGYYAQQRPCLTYGHSQRDGLDAGSLEEAVRERTERSRCGGPRPTTGRPNGPGSPPPTASSTTDCCDEEPRAPARLLCGSP